MTEYEMMDVLGVNTGNLIAGTGVYFSILTGYLIVAYAVGRKLTVYQVSFINVVFLLFNFMSGVNFAAMTERSITVSQDLLSLSGATRMVGEEASAVIISLFVLMRTLLVLGALIFMWQIRHPKE